MGRAPRWGQHHQQRFRCQYDSPQPFRLLGEQSRRRRHYRHPRQGLGKRKIRVNSINPGESQSPLGRIGQTDDVSPTAVYLASSNSKYLTGETVRVTGGIL